MHAANQQGLKTFSTLGLPNAVFEAVMQLHVDNIFSSFCWLCFCTVLLIDHFALLTVLR